MCFTFSPNPVQLEDASHELVNRIVLRREDAIYLQPEKVLEALSPGDRLSRNLSSLLRISTAINSIRVLSASRHGSTQEAFAKPLLELIFEVIPAERGAILLVNGGSAGFVAVYALDRVRGPDQPVRISSTIVRQVLQQGVAILNNDLETSGVYDSARSLAEMSIRSVLTVPLFTSGRTEGVIYLDTKNPKVQFDKDHLELLTAVANIAGMGLDYTRHIEQLVKMERERHRSLAQMAAGIAHEINTPLGIVNTAASILTEKLTPDMVAALARDEQSRAVLDDLLEAGQLIQANLARASRLVQNFKNLSISEATEKREKVDICGLVRDIVGLYRPQASIARLNIEIRDQLVDQSREWLGYPGYLAQIILNLLTNIERYAYLEGQGGRVEITIAADAAKEESFHLTVRDFGSGIEPQNLPKIFQAFFTTGREKGGTGLGMAIVHSLVTATLKGEIDIESEPGKGTTVSIFLPRIVPE